MLNLSTTLSTNSSAVHPCFYSITWHAGHLVFPWTWWAWQRLRRSKQMYRLFLRLWGLFPPRQQLWRLKYYQRSRTLWNLSWTLHGKQVCKITGSDVTQHTNSLDVTRQEFEVFSFRYAVDFKSSSDVIWLACYVQSRKLDVTVFWTEQSAVRMCKLNRYYTFIVEYWVWSQNDE